ncbi:MAG TPA: YciI family protein [Solirubrobacteraceae bacterium]|nr:YciI family protein [Solirubrobacteraceae bacterium]
MPQYAALVYEPGDPDWSTLDTPEKERTMGEYGAFGAAAAAVLRGGAALYPTSTATMVRVHDDNVLTSDGPFAETKEVLTGFYLMECADLDEAVRWASQIPAARTGGVEVRPIIDFGGSAG